MRARLLTGLVLIAALAVTAPPAAAAELSAQCTNPEALDYLQTRLDAANNGDVITLVEGSVCSPGDLESDDEFRLKSDTQITLQGNGTGAPEVLDGEGEYRTLRGSDVGATVIRNLTFRNAEYNGSGAAIKIQGLSAPTISNVQVVRSESGGRAPVTIDADGDAGTVTVENSHFGVLDPEEDDGNGNSGEEGGAVHIDTAKAIVLAGNTMRGNEASRSGGGAVLRLRRGEGDAAPVTVTDNRFLGNTVAYQGEGCCDDTLTGGGLSIETSTSTRSVTQARNLFDSNTIVAFIFFQGPDRGFFRSGRFFGGGEYTEASVVSTDDQYIANSIAFPDIEGRGLEVQGEISGGGLSVNGFGVQFTGRNLVAAANVIDHGEGAGIASRRDFGNSQDTARSEVDASVLQLLDSTVVENDAGSGTGSAIAGTFDDRLHVHNGIVYGNGPDDTEEIAGFDDGGIREILFTDACDDEGTAPVEGEGNICQDPLLKDPEDGDVHETDASPTRDRGSNALVPDDLPKDYEGDARISDSGTDGARVDMGADERGTPAPEPTVTPTPTPQPAAGAVAGSQQRRCVSRRRFRIRIRVPRGQKALSAVVRVNGKRVKVVRGKRLTAPVRLRGLPKGRFKVRITIRLRNGKQVTGTRTYHTCVPKRPGDGPPPV